MSYTNSTPNLHLPQYIATDKPTYLGDWNASMQTIDTVITATQATANGASSTAITAASAASDAQNTANSALNKANTNAQDIATINNNFTDQFDTFEPLNSNSLITMNRHDNYSTIIYYSYRIPKDSFTNSVVVGTDTYIPMFQSARNIYNLKTSSISNLDDTLYFPGQTVQFEPNSSLQTYFCSVYAVWDGAHTIYYYKIDTTTLSTIRAGSYMTIWGSLYYQGNSGVSN